MTACGMMNGWHLGSLKFLLDTQIPRYLTVHQFSRLVFFQLSSCMGCTRQSKYCCRSYAEDVAQIFNSVQQCTPITYSQNLIHCKQTLIANNRAILVAYMQYYRVLVTTISLRLQMPSMPFLMCTMLIYLHRY